MSLLDWRKFGWLKPHETSLEELRNLLAIADRDIADAGADSLSADWRFGIAYNAALKLCTMMLYDAGFMPEKTLAHYRTLLSIQYTLGEHRKSDAEYLDACRVKRNHVEYDYVNGASETEAHELVAFAKELRAEVVEKLKAKYPDLGIAVEDPPE
jgi:hypothetical protein